MEHSLSHGRVLAVCMKAEPGLPKFEVDAVELVENYGIEGDYHAGKFVRHRYLAKKNPDQPNLRQVLIVDDAIVADVAQRGIHLEPGMLGENIVVSGIDVMSLSIGAQIEIGQALLAVTEVRNPCLQLNEMHPNLLKAVVDKIDGQVYRNAGMMARVLRGGRVAPGDPVVVHVKPSVL